MGEGMRFLSLRDFIVLSELETMIVVSCVEDWDSCPSFTSDPHTVGVSAAPAAAVADGDKTAGSSIDTTVIC